MSKKYILLRSDKTTGTACIKQNAAIDQYNFFFTIGHFMANES